MKVKYDQIVEMLLKSFESGEISCPDMKEDIIDNIIAEVIGKKRDFRIYSVEELRLYPVGSKFCHSFFGKGVVASKDGVSVKFMKFDNGVINAFVADQFPWTVPMLFLGDEDEVV